MITRVINRYSGLAFDLYVARPSQYGNPYGTRAGTLAGFIVETREEALRGYETWLQARPLLIARVRQELRGKTLACWCVDDLDGKAPIVCHAQILARVADGADLPVLPVAGSLDRLAASLARQGGD